MPGECPYSVTWEGRVLGCGDFAELCEVLAEDDTHQPNLDQLDADERRIVDAILQLRELAFAARDYAVASKRFRASGRIEDRERCLQLDEQLITKAASAA